MHCSYPRHCYYDDHAGQLGIRKLGRSRVVQWLGLNALTAEGPGSVSGRGNQDPTEKGKKILFKYSFSSALAFCMLFFFLPEEPLLLTAYLAYWP